MAELRLIALCALASGRAGAAPHKLDLPAGWRALPALAAAVGKAADGATAAAWGEPARGCYAVAFDVRGPAAAADALADQLIAALPKQIAVHDVARPAAGADRGVLAFSFEGGGYHGRVRAQLARDGSIGAATCFWNDREPAACSTACQSLLGRLAP
ncbi:MAG TPA: hypothetical protein VLX92_10610 [Kofleriaceae bacterium]|nr:hypothetical protein [Kofleriaceae bacterium]